MGSFATKKTCPNSSDIVQTCPKLSEIVLRLSGIVQICQKLSKIFQNCLDLSANVQTCQIFSRVVQTCLKLVQTCSKWSEIVHIGLDKFSVQIIFLGCRNRGCKGQGWCRICHSLHGLRSCPIHRFANESQVWKRGMCLFTFFNTFISLSEIAGSMESKRIVSNFFALL